MTSNLFRKNNILDIQNNILDKISFPVHYGPLVGQIIEYTNIRYDKINDILYFEYSFEREVEVHEEFNLNEYLSTLLKMHLAFTE